MAAAWRRLNLMLAGTTPARRFQEEADVGVAAVLMSFRALKLAPGNADKDPGELFNEAVALMEKKKFDKQKEFVQEQTATQMCAMFDAILQQPAKPKEGQSKISLSGFDKLEDVNARGAPKSLEEALGFSLSVKESSVPNAGQGVRLNGKASIGSLVSLFPGVVYLPEHFKKPQYLKEIADNAYARARFDSVIIDAKNEPIEPRNPFAVAHKINHPPEGTPPNVLPFAFDFPPEEPFTSDAYQALTPNAFVETPSRWSMFGKRVHVHGLAFIATADIEDQELFLNYRYNPDRPLPDWYTPVDVESDRAMWK